MKRRILLILTIATILAGGSAYAWHRTHRGTQAGSSVGTTQQREASGHNQNGSATPTPNVTPPPNGTQPDTSSPQTYLVKVYFSKHTASDNDPSAVFAVNRTTNTLGVAQFAIAQTLQGPTASEQHAGYFTTVRLRTDASSCNGQDFTITIVNGTATLQFCRSFDHLGTVADGQAKSELTATLQQFSSVKKVVILNKNGHCEFDLSGMDLCKQ